MIKVFTLVICGMLLAVAPVQADSGEEDSTEPCVTYGTTYCVMDDAGSMDRAVLCVHYGNGLKYCYVTFGGPSGNSWVCASGWNHDEPTGIEDGGNCIIFN